MLHGHGGNGCVRFSHADYFPPFPPVHMQMPTESPLRMCLYCGEPSGQFMFASEPMWLCTCCSSAAHVQVGAWD
jgi:hypothetical protein